MDIHLLHYTRTCHMCHRSQQEETSPGTDSPSLTDKDTESEEEDEEGEKTTPTYIEVDSDITFNFTTTNLTTGQGNLSSQSLPSLLGPLLLLQHDLGSVSFKSSRYIFCSLMVLL